MAIKLVKTLKFQDDVDSYQIDAVHSDSAKKLDDVTSFIDNKSITYNNASERISLKQEYIDYLDAQVYKYPSISSFNIVGGNQEVGTTVNITSFTHKETNIQNISGNLTLTCNKNNSLQLLVEPSSSDSSVAFSDSYRFLNSTTLTYTLSGEDTRGNIITKTDSVSSYFPSFMGSSKDASLDSQEGLTKVASSSLVGTRTITADNDYVYFVTTTAIKSIKSGGFDVSYTKQDNVNLTINGISQSYHVYRTNELITSTLTYVIT